MNEVRYNLQNISLAVEGLIIGSGSIGKRLANECTMGNPLDKIDWEYLHNHCDAWIKEDVEYLKNKFEEIEALSKKRIKDEIEMQGIMYERGIRYNNSVEALISRMKGQAKEIAKHLHNIHMYNCYKERWGNE